MEHGVFAQPLGLFLIIFLISKKRQSSSFLVLFGVLFLSKPCKIGFLGWLKNKDRRKIREKEEEDVRAAGFFYGIEGRAFWYFFRAFFVDAEGWRAKNIFCKSAKKKFA